MASQFIREYTRSMAVYRPIGHAAGTRQSWPWLDTVPTWSPESGRSSGSSPTQTTREARVFRALAPAHRTGAADPARRAPGARVQAVLHRTVRIAARGRGHT